MLFGYHLGSSNCPANPTRYPTSANPPYSGTIFNFPGVITASGK